MIAMGYLATGEIFGKNILQLKCVVYISKKF